jgi:hypothetical protein
MIHKPCPIVPSPGIAKLKVQGYRAIGDNLKPADWWVFSIIGFQLTKKLHLKLCNNSLQVPLGRYILGIFNFNIGIAG